MLIKKKVNLAQLDKELNGKGLNAIHDKNGDITEITLSENNDATVEELQMAIDSHIAIDETVAKQSARAALLEKLGITEEEAKLLFS